MCACYRGMYAVVGVRAVPRMYCKSVRRISSSGVIGCVGGRLLVVSASHVTSRKKMKEDSIIHKHTHTKIMHLPLPSALKFSGKKY